MTNDSTTDLMHIGGDLWARRNGRYLDVCDRDGKMLLFISKAALERAVTLAPSAADLAGTEPEGSTVPSPRPTKTVTRKVADLIEAKEDSPLPLSVIPNYMGINLCSVDAVSWTKQEDGQLVDLTIHFIPAEQAPGES